MGGRKVPPPRATGYVGPHVDFPQLARPRGRAGGRSDGGSEWGGQGFRSRRHSYLVELDYIAFLNALKVPTRSAICLYGICESCENRLVYTKGMPSTANMLLIRSQVPFNLYQVLHFCGKN